MDDWLDVVLLGGEADLVTFLEGLSAENRTVLRGRLASVVGMSSEALETAELRVLIERARPFALPQALWSRSILSSDPVEPLIDGHLDDLGLDKSADRVAKMRSLQANFVEPRGKRVSERLEILLNRQDFRCALCGLRYYNEELEALGTITSPYNFRGPDKIDPVKPHWRSVEQRLPRVDHIWPVSLYGSNRLDNLQVICDACNSGKANYTFLAQSARYVGIPTSDELSSPSLRISPALFVAQMWRQPRCVDTGVSAREAELTVRVRELRFPFVLDNLETVVSPD